RDGRARGSCPTRRSSDLKGGESGGGARRQASGGEGREDGASAVHECLLVGRRNALCAVFTFLDNHNFVVNAAIWLSQKEAAPCLDRKSTRLNSSHVKISY